MIYYVEDADRYLALTSNNSKANAKFVSIAYTSLDVVEKGEEFDEALTIPQDNDNGEFLIRINIWQWQAVWIF